MKKLVFLVVVCFSFVVKAQYFNLTPEGFKSYNGSGFVVLEIEGKQNELYQKTLVYLNSIYINPKEVLSFVENESININGFSANSVKRTNSHRFDMGYNLVVLFKDNKIRINAPSFKLTTYTSKRQQMLLYRKGTDLTGTYFGVYGKNGKVRFQKALDDLNSFFNDFINDLYKALSSSDNNW